MNLPRRPRRRHRVAWKWWYELMRLNCGEGWQNLRRRRFPLTDDPTFLAAHICVEQPELDKKVVLELCIEIEKGDNECPTK